MSVLFNTISQFVESVGQRREHRSNPTQLDTLECVFTGPSALATDFVPIDLAVHPVYQGMTCSSWQVTNKEGLVAEARAQYTGKLSARTGPYTTAPLITTSRHLGSISYTTSYSNSPIQIATASYTIRYTAKAVTFKYLTNRVPAAGFSGSFNSAAQPYLGVENVKKFISALAFSTGSADSGYLETVLIMENDLSDLQVNALGNGWWEVSEIYLTQPLLNTFIIGVPGQTFTSSSTLYNGPPLG